MHLEKAYDRVDWLALREVLRIYGVGGKLLSLGLTLGRLMDLMEYHLSLLNTVPPC